MTATFIIWISSMSERSRGNADGPLPRHEHGQGWREAPGGLWVTTPGCYAWQVDGLTFSEVIMVQAVAQ